MEVKTVWMVFCLDNHHPEDGLLDRHTKLPEVPTSTNRSQHSQRDGRAVFLSALIY